jgi:hypothetical protein
MLLNIPPNLTGLTPNVSVRKNSRRGTIMFIFLSEKDPEFV